MRFRFIELLFVFLIFTQLSVIGQEPEFGCSAEDLETFIADGTSELEEGSLDYIYRLGDLYTAFALQCEYQPSTEEVITQIDRALELAPLSFIIAQSSIGSDVDTAMVELESVNGDLLNGQLLYNGLEMGLDGAELGCSGCHNGEAAPTIEGTYTRVDEIRLALPEFAEYSIEQYLVESILHPEAYIIPEYSAVQMPHNYGGRLDAQQLADIVAYLESQDQLLDEASTTMTDTVLGNDISDLTQDIMENYVGDPIQGEYLYSGNEPAEGGIVLGCTACHMGGILAPDTVGTWSRIVDERLNLDQFEDYSPEEYIIESIILPNDFVVEGYAGGIMPGNYDNLLSHQDLADLVAYLSQTN